MSKNVTYIKRHKKGFIYFHWINAVTFFPVVPDGDAALHQ